MLVSVIIPTFNRRELLKRAIDSALHQDYSEVEIIIIDDGSTDGTAKMVEKRYPDVKLFIQENAGVSAARNVGISHAKGEWISFLDSDDVWLPYKLTQQMKALAGTDYRICHCNEKWIRHGKHLNPMTKHKKEGGWVFQANLKLCLISPSSVMIHQSIFDEIGVFDESLPACEDYDLWLRLTSRHPVLYLKQALIIKYGGHEDQLSSKYWGMDRFRIKALQKILNENILSEVDRDAACTVLKDKVEIYLNGAKKRNKTEEVDYYEKILQDYS